MRDTIIDVYDNPDMIIELGEIPEYTKEDYDLEDEKDYKAFINDAKKMVRGSYEYKSLIQYLKQHMDMNKCSYFTAMSGVDLNKVKIELHHDPFDLETIVRVVVRKKYELGEDLSVESVAYEVMYLHYSFMVNLIPLCETVHELVHNQFIFIPADKSYGDYKGFVEFYKPYFTEEELEKIENIENMTACVNNYKNVLKTNYIHIDHVGDYALPNMDEIQSLMSDRLQELKTEQRVGIDYDNIRKEPIRAFTKVPKNAIRAFEKV